MENYNGIAISKNDKEFVVAFDNFVNGKMQSATNTGKALATIHRYLQSQAFKVCVAYFRQLAVTTAPAIMTSGTKRQHVEQL